VRVDAQLEAVPSTGTVRFESSPSGADVFVEGRYLGTTPLGPREYRPGRYDVAFERAGYLPERTTFRVEAGERQTVRVSLQPRLGRLEVVGNVGGARVFLDGREVGRLASGSGRLEIDQLQPGERELTLVAPGYATVVTRVDVDAGETREIRVRQTRR
jgi:hypothetical protein